MNYTYMQTFYVVAKHGNISKAAKELFLTQPAVSRIIANLETEYGTKLFHRSKGGVALSKEGLHLYELIKQPFAELERLEHDIANKTALYGNVVHVGTTTTALYVYLFRRLDNIKRQFPDINFRLYTGSSKQLLEMVRDGKVDFALITTPFALGEGIEVVTIQELHDIVVAPKSMEKEFTGKVAIKDLAKYPFILLNKNMQFREHIDNFLSQEGVKLMPTYELDNSSNIMPLVEGHFGLSIIPYEIAEHSIQEGKCIRVELEKEPPLRYISFAIKTNANYSNAIYAIKKSIVG